MTIFLTRRISPRYDEAASFPTAPEKKRVYSLDSPPGHNALSFPVDLTPASDYDFGISNYSLLSFSDGSNTAINSTPFDGIPISFNNQDFVPFARSRSMLSQQVSPFNSSLAPQSNGPNTPCPQPVVGHMPEQPQPIDYGPSRVSLSRLPRLQCSQCQKYFVDMRQLK
jgi:hypothetical protein